MADFIFVRAGYLLVVLLLTYFNAVVVCTEYDRQNSGAADFRAGLEMANDHLGGIVLWGTCVAWILPLLRLASLVGLPGRRGRALHEVLAARTLVVPSMLLEGLTPLDAASRARELHRSAWGSGEQASFGFAMLGWSALVFTGLIAMGAWRTILDPMPAAFLAVVGFALVFSLIKTPGAPGRRGTVRLRLCREGRSRLSRGRPARCVRAS